MQEYDVVKTVRELNEKVPKDSVGTILMILSPTNYEVEFVNPKGDTLDVITVSESDIIKYNPNKLSSD